MQSDWQQHSWLQQQKEYQRTLYRNRFPHAALLLSCMVISMSWTTAHLDEKESKNHWCTATVQSQTKLTYKSSLLHSDQSRKDRLKGPLWLQSMCISLLLKKGIINHYLLLLPRSDNSKFPSAWCLWSFITGLSYFWCLSISGGVSYTIGSHSSLPLTVRLLTAFKEGEK